MHQIINLEPWSVTAGLIMMALFHRALADAEMTARLWIAMIDEIRETFRINHVSFELMQKLSRISKAMAPEYLTKVGKGE